MGANAQTTVPTFTAAQVLTADQMNQSARTGVPVFADTTARDAGFGGTGEKTLAEGQLCYVENLAGVAQIQYYDGSSWLSLTTPGLVCVKAETAFTAASSVTADSVFSSSYTNYRVLIRYETSSTGAISMKMRVGGVSASTNYNTQDVAASGTSTSAARLTAQTSAQIGVYTNGAFPSFITMDLCGPNLAASTQFTSVDSHNLGAFTGIRYTTTMGNHSTATAYDGIELLVASGTMTGTYAIYGYSKVV